MPVAASCISGDILGCAASPDFEVPELINKTVPRAASCISGDILGCAASPDFAVSVPELINND